MNSFVLEGVVQSIDIRLTDKNTAFRMVFVDDGVRVVPFSLFGNQDTIIRAGEHIHISGFLAGYRDYVRYEVMEIKCADIAPD